MNQRIFKEFDEGNLGLDVVKRLIWVAVHGVNYCDGNEDEAVQDSYLCRCGNCLKRMKVGERIYSSYQSHFEWRIITDEIESGIAYPSFCPDCLMDVLGKEEVQNIIENNEDEKNTLVKEEWNF